MSTDLGGDIKLIFSGTTPETLGPADISIPSGATEPVRDSGLETAIMIALFTDRRAEPDDVLPNDTDTRRGYFADALTGTRIGSRLWLLERSRLDDNTLLLAKQYAEEALNEQIVDTGIAASVEVATAKEGDRLKFSIAIIGLDTQSVFYEYFLNWQSQLGRVR